ELVRVGAIAPLIVLDAEVLEDFTVRGPKLGRIRDVERLGERARIVDRHDALQGVVVGPREALDEVQFLRVWRSCAVEPEPVVEADGIDDEGRTLPVTDRVAEPRRRRIVGMLADRKSTRLN